MLHVWCKGAVAVKVVSAKPTGKPVINYEPQCQDSVCHSLGRFNKTKWPTFTQKKKKSYLLRRSREMPMDIFNCRYRYKYQKPSPQNCLYRLHLNKSYILYCSIPTSALLYSIQLQVSMFDVWEPVPSVLFRTSAPSLNKMAAHTTNSFLHREL